MNPPADSNPTSWFEVIRQVMITGQLPDPWPGEGREAQNWLQFAQEWLELRDFALALSLGDLTGKLTLPGQLAGSLKALQAGLSYLTWQTERVADGDLSERVNFMGEFSAAFNHMTDSITRARQELSASEERYRKLVEASPDAVAISDLAGKVIFASPSKHWTAMQVDIQDILGHSLMEWVPPPERSVIAKRIVRLMAGEEVGPYKVTLRHHDGQLFPSELFSSTLRDSAGKPVGMITIIRDISEQVRREQALHEQTALAEALRDSAAALNSALGLEQVLDVILNSLCSVLLHDAAAILLLDQAGTAHIDRFTSYERLSPEQETRMAAMNFPLSAYPNLRAMAETLQPLLIDDVSTYNWVNFTPMEWIRSYLGVPILMDGRVVGFIGLYGEETNYFIPEHAARLTALANQAAIAIQKAHLYDELHRLATTDGLTGISNRRSFFAQAELEFERVARYGKHLTAMMLDIDYFKQINDTHGHAVGDLVLAKVAQVCLRSLRSTDLLGRYGGEEFVFLMPETDGPEACAAAERLRQSIAATPFCVESTPIAVTVSIGVARLTSPEDRLDALLNRADMALLRAKQAGRNRVEYTPGLISSLH